MDDFHPYNRERRQSFRIIKGGKDTPTLRLDRTQLDGDPFLREHYLGQSKDHESKLFLSAMVQETAPPEVS
jgi:hypothetical protein